MNIGFWSCIILVIPFVIIGVLFAIFKEKAAKFVSGFNSFSKEEQALYDKACLSITGDIERVSPFKVLALSKFYSNKLHDNLSKNKLHIMEK